MSGRAATVSFSIPIYATPLRYRTKFNSLNLRACLNEYPLASRIMIKNLSYSTTEGTLQSEFSNFGQIAEVKLVKDEATKKSKGYAFIQYTCQDDAILALENMDQEEFDGRMLHIEIAKPVRSSFKGYPITSGPPPKTQRFPEQDEVADCWY
ncbi:cold-inducible RNA-binding protein B-like [Tripterygium wilfordii]|uniref:Cold-inducible RNA-binding protein B-like n=1 Tax=Tripterygium wilfordii TaxID=458696 RepID=A0A7J7C630_TRIWF|nr:glycine-rich RNA-binding protein 4, mitochondrial [Tripterygium wilfordii]KAF5729226.1 cold-inducible RNA-binding protein B-like [Tripterygium wilfordii]